MTRFRLKRTALLGLILLVLPLVALSQRYKFTIVIDAGHGGKDPGAIGTYSKEKNINLNVALRVGRLIEANCNDVKVVYTRKSDVFVELDERANIANRNKADLFLSIHTNAVAGSRSIVGAETYSLGMARAQENLDVAKRENEVILYENNYEQHYAGFNPNSSESYIIFDFMQDQYMKQSAEFANLIQQQYVSVAGRPNKGVHQAGFLVLRKTSMPSVLTELGFITTPSEEKYLNSSEGTEQLAQSIYRGFLAYRRTHGGQPQTATTPEPKVDPTPANDPTPEPAKPDDTKPEQTTTNTPVLQDQTEQQTQATQQTPIKQDAQTQTQPTDPKQGKDNKAKPNTAQGIVYKLQIYISQRCLHSDAQQFKGLKGVDYYAENNTYKYTYGNTASYSEIVALKKEIQKSFPDCFVVAFRDGEKISVADARSEQTKK